MAEQRCDGTPLRLHTGEGGRALQLCLALSQVWAGKGTNLPYYLFQSEVGKLRHRRVMTVQGLSSLLDKSVSLLCSALLRTPEQSGTRLS